MNNALPLIAIMLLAVFATGIFFIGYLKTDRQNGREAELSLCVWIVACILMTIGLSLLYKPSDPTRAYIYAGACFIVALAATAFVRFKSGSFYNNQLVLAARNIEKLREENARLRSSNEGLQQEQWFIRFCIDHSLTEKEVEILLSLRAEKTARMIAEENVLSVNTVNTHIRHIYKKTGVKTREELLSLLSTKTQSK